MSAPRRKIRQAPRLAVERLENRTLLSVDLVGGVLHIDGSPHNDKIIVGVAGNVVRVRENREVHTFDLDDVRQVKVRSFRGDDKVVVRNNVVLETTLSGGRGDDTLVGGSGNDVAHGRSGRDVVRGRSGDDKLYGEGQPDSLYGGQGMDSIYGGRGDDSIRGGHDSDDLHGKQGDDDLRGGPGNDQLHGDQGNDDLYGGRGSDDFFHDDHDDVHHNRQDESHQDDDIVVSNETEFETLLTGTGNAYGKAEYKEKTFGTATERKFEVEVWVPGAASGTSYDVMVDNVTVGQVVVDASGHGKLELTNHADEANEHPFPTDFPTGVGAGSAVAVDAVLQGNLA